MGRGNTLLGEAMAEAGLQDIETYVAHSQNTFAQYIVTRKIMDLCLAAGRRPRARVSRWCWEQETLDMEGTREAARVVKVEKD